MEKLFHYVWKHRLFPLKDFVTTDGRRIEVVDVGLLNSDAGPDFFNAKVRIDGQLWVGNVELHMRSSLWKQHGHDTDAAYNNVILHVVNDVDTENVYNAKGEKVPQIELPIPERIRTNYEHLLTEDRYPRCYRLIPHVAPEMLSDWLAYLYIERLERKANDILARLDECKGSWEDVFFRTLARNFGFGLNADAFEQWAKSFPLHAVDHHRDDLFQIEAVFFGQAGLLNADAAREKQRAAMEADEYFQRLLAEYRYLAKKFTLTPINAQLWRFLRLRPPGFPTIRLSQLAQLHYNRTAGMSNLLACNTVRDVEKALATHATPYWQTHFLFGEESEKSIKSLSKTSIEIIIINTIVPLFYAYGRFRHDKQMRDKAFTMMEKVKPERNNIVELWRECGLEVNNACDSQALIQLKKDYCDRKDCLRCRIGYQYLRVDEKDL
ncbi:MAG: DUF2851 family protein [Prevotella sp.]|nr:DUF2851 family protein [Prevotella sp.]